MGRGGAAWPRVVMILSENAPWWPERDLGALVRAAVDAEAAGVDAVMFSEHVVLGARRRRRRRARPIRASTP